MVCIEKQLWVREEKATGLNAECMNPYSFSLPCNYDSYDLWVTHSDSEKTWVHLIRAGRVKYFFLMNRCTKTTQMATFFRRLELQKQNMSEKKIKDCRTSGVHYPPPPPSRLGLTCFILGSSAKPLGLERAVRCLTMCLKASVFPEPLSPLRRQKKTSVINALMRKLVYYLLSSALMFHILNDGLAAFFQSVS